MNEDIGLLSESNSAFISVITGSDIFHPKLSTLVALYVNILDKDISFIIPVDHPEQTSHVCMRELIHSLSKIENLFCIDKKSILYFLGLKNLKDVKFAIDTFEVINSSYETWVYSKNKNYEEVNKLIPLSKHLERCNQQFSEIKDKITSIVWDESIKFLNDIFTPVFYLIEKNGLKITYGPFVDIFKPGIPELNIRDNITYSCYNLYNTTSRPTNSFNGVNYAAIPKKQEYRKCFTPQNDMFVELDFDGYHIRLLAEQVGFTLSSEPAHTQLARLYFNKQDITKEEYIQSKQINFQALYGHTPEEHKDFKLFKLIENWTQEIWNEFSTKGYVNAPISNKRFTSNIEGMYPKKLLNYIIQAMETARNTIVLKNALQFLDKKKTTISLYTYDSVLIDFSKEDGKETLETLENILSENNKYPVKFKYSNNLVFD